MSRSAGTLVTVVTCLGVVLSPARGQTPPPKGPGYEKAAVLFKEGIALFNKGYYHKAIAKFRKAYKHYESPKVHTRIALCYKWLGDNLKALHHYELFLKQFAKNPTNDADRVLRNRVKMEVRNLLLLVGRLRLKIDRPAGAEVRVNGRLVGKAPMDKTLRVKPGKVSVTVMATGFYSFRRDVDVLPSRTAPVGIALVRIKPKVVREVVRIPSTPIHKRWWFWTAIGALVAGGATGLALGLGMQEKPRDLRGTPIRHDGLSVKW